MVYGVVGPLQGGRGSSERWWLTGFGLVAGNIFLAFGRMV